MPDMKRVPAYHDEDALHLMGMAGPIALFLSNKSILRYLQRVLHEARGYEHLLSMYPAVMCEPLDRLYVFRRASCSLDEALLQDLLFSYNWRQANWGAWLAALRPDARYAVHLERRRDTLPHGTTIANLAISACRGTPVPDELSSHDALLQSICGLLEQLPELKSPLRRNPTEAEHEVLDANYAAIKEAYSRGDRAEVDALLQHPLLRHFFLSHRDWVRTRLPSRH